MKRTRALAFLAVACSMTLQAMNWDSVFLIGNADRNKAFYKPGETMTFNLKVDFKGQKPDKPCYIQWKRMGDDGKTLAGKQTPDKTLVIKTSLDKPGFVRITAHLVDEKGNRIIKKNPKLMWDHKYIFFDGGAAVQPEKIPQKPEPEDFDQFWNSQKKRLEKVAFQGKVTLEPRKSQNPKIKLFAVSVPCAGPRPVTGYLSIPIAAKPKSLPAMCVFEGYGTLPQKAPRWSDPRYIVFNVNAHGYDLDQTPEYYKAFFQSIRTKKYSYAFDPQQNAKHETAYFNGMALRVMRALQFVTSRPEWNQKDLIARGGSQGGLQTVWAAALEPRVTKAFPTVPWCCDLSGQETFGRIHGGWRIKWTPILDYYDPIYMAKRIPRTCHVNIRAGLGDYVCPPSGVTLLYNNIKAPKQILWIQGATHGFIPPYRHQRFTLSEP